MWFGPHVCDEACEGPLGCREGKSEQGRFQRIQQAKQVCKTCPELIPCAIWAITTGQGYGVWGGMTERERNEKRRELRGY